MIGIDFFLNSFKVTGEFPLYTDKEKTTKDIVNYM